MKQFLQTITFFLTLSLAAATLAHEGHDEVQLDLATAVEAAGTKMQELIMQGQLDAKWAMRPAAGAQLARIEGRQNWIVSYLDADERTRLEMVFTTTGEFVSMAQSRV